MCNTQRGIFDRLARVKRYHVATVNRPVPRAADTSDDMQLHRGQAENVVFVAVGRQDSITQTPSAPPSPPLKRRPAPRGGDVMERRRAFTKQPMMTSGDDQLLIHKVAPELTNPLFIRQRKLSHDLPSHGIRRRRYKPVT